MKRSAYAIRASTGALLVMWIVAACGVPSDAADAAQPQSDATSAPASASADVTQPAQQVVPVELPAGLRTALYDDTNGSLWILSDVTDPDAVLLTQVTRPDGEDTTTVRLSAENADWQRGALAVNGDVVWAAWGTHLVRFDSTTKGITQIGTPWTDLGGPDGRVASIAATKDAVWVAVVGEPDLRRFDPQDGTWTTTATPGGNAVSEFTSLAVSGSTVLANVGSESAALTSPAVGTGVAWVPENEVPLSSAGQVAVVGDAGAVVTGHQAVAFADRSDSPAAVIPTGFDGTSVTRVTQTAGRIVVAHTDLADGRSQTQVIAAATVEIPQGPPMPSGTQSQQTGWMAAKVNAVAATPDGATWIVSQYGTDAPTGWGTVVYVPPPA